jgi:[ribosomal protein S5]-alanine N-acetyltransferase
MDDRTGFQPFLATERIYLREVRASDVNDAYYRWMNDREVTRHLESRFHPHSREELLRYVQEHGGPQDFFFAILLHAGDHHVGNIKIEPVNWIHRSGEIGILIGEKDCWGKGYATEAIRLIVGFAFQELNLHKLTAGCYGANAGSVKAFQKAGFQIEGVRKQQFFSGGQFVDGILLGLVRPDGQ